jgi:hypothetical protein
MGSKISLVIQGHEIPFPGAHIYRRLSKNLILFNLPYFEKTGSGGTIGRDLLRVEDQFTLEGIFEDDVDEAKYDGWPAFGRYQLIIAIAKKKRITCSLVWKTKTYSVILKTSQFVKNSGEGQDISYTIVAVRVTDGSH